MGAIADMMAFAEAGITAFDCADIYTGVEELIGEFLRAWRAAHGPSAPAIRVHTKCVPDLRRAAHAGARRHRTPHRPLAAATWGSRRSTWCSSTGGTTTSRGWWRPRCICRELQQPGKIRHLGVTNFDTPHLRALLDAGVPIVSHQVQCSVLDRRALGDMAALCAERGVGLLAYGALAGGFLHERWLGAAEPTASFENRSLVKYKLIIDEFGGWSAFQRLLAALHRIALAHGTTIGAVALRSVLDEPAIAAAIVGARHSAHLPATLAALELALTAEDREALAMLLRAATGPRGDVYALEREKGGRHAAIMRYNLNTERP